MLRIIIVGMLLLLTFQLQAAQPWKTIKHGLALLKVDDERQRRYNQTYPGCWLGDKFYMVGDRWSPNIESRGVMPCVKCQCAQVVKKQKIQIDGRIVCVNVRNECPRTHCDDPVTRPNTCCKVCLGQDVLFDTRGNHSVYEATVHSHQSKDKGPFLDMTAVLVGRPGKRNDLLKVEHGYSRSKMLQVKTRAVGVVHLTHLTKDTFRYRVWYTRLKNPTKIQFKDKQGVVLMETSIERRETRSGNFNGVLRDVPFEYMIYIQQQIVTISIATSRHKNGEIFGTLEDNTMVTNASFEALLSPPLRTGIGAHVTLFYDSTSMVASYVIRIKGIKSGKTEPDDYFVTFEKDTEIIQQYMLRMAKSNDKLVGTFNVDTKMSKQMARSRLHVRVTSRSGDTMTGALKPRLLRSDLGSVFHDRNKDDSITGYMVLRIQEDGSLRYKIKINGINHKTNTTATLQRYIASSNIWKDFITLMDNAEQAGPPINIEKIGINKKLRAQDTVTLLDDEVRLNIQTSGYNVIRHFQRDDNTLFDIFNAKQDILSSTMCPEIGFIWYQVVENCSFAYIVRTSLSKDIQQIKLELSTHQQHYFGDDDNRVLQDNLSPAGVVTDISDVLWKSLNHGSVDLRIKYRTGDCDEFYNQIHLPNECWRRDDGAYILSGTDNYEPEVNNQDIFRCLYESKIYQHAESWIPNVNSDCVTCRCKHGTVYCDTTPCPPKRCDYPIKRPGECCNVCDENNETEMKDKGSCYYHGDKRWHPVGAFWHPYVPPFGYSKCAVCNCMAGSLEVNCTKTPCPTLNCPTHRRMRINRDDCCQVCKEEFNYVGNKSGLQTSSKDCKFGNTEYRHGDKWHPRVTPFGPMKCYRCSCNNGKTRCRKLKCHTLRCKKQYTPRNKCCPVCWKRRNEIQVQ